MNTSMIRFRCPYCKVRIKGHFRLGGRRRKCPKCVQVFKVPRLMPQDAEPMLVISETKDYLSLGVTGDFGDTISMSVPA